MPSCRGGVQASCGELKASWAKAKQRGQAERAMPPGVRKHVSE